MNRSLFFLSVSEFSAGICYFLKLILNYCADSEFKSGSSRVHLFFVVFLCMFMLSAVSCEGLSDSSDTPGGDAVNYRGEMRTFVEEISEYAKNKNPGFLIIPQNGQTVAWDKNSAADGTVPPGAGNAAYMTAIDGTGREDTFYGYNSDNTATEDAVSLYLTGVCKKFLAQGKPVLSVDYCSSEANIVDSYKKNADCGFIGFAEPDRELAIIPENDKYDAAYYPNKKNTGDVNTLSDAKNFLFLLKGTSKNFSF
jgi:cysteinyl-tRNA synthetase, unknown class